MKAAVVSKLGKLDVWDIPIPQVGPYDALCKMCFGATCAGTDIHLMDGKHPYSVTFPTILGHESVGRVVEIGSKVRNFKVGDLVSRVGCPAEVQENLSSNWGGFSEYGIAKDHWQMRYDGLLPLEWERSRVNQIIHPEIDERTAPMIITWRETLSYLRRLGVKAGDRILLLGSGANALSFAAHACASGAAVTVVGSQKRKSVFEYFSISDYQDYRDPDLVQKFNKDANVKYDFLLDAVGSGRTLNAMLPCLKRNGVVAVYGWNDRKTYGINPFSAAGSIFVYGDGYDEEESNGEVQSMILRGQLQAELWYDKDHPVPLHKIGYAYDELRRGQAMKYLIQL